MLNDSQKPSVRLLGIAASLLAMAILFGLANARVRGLLVNTGLLAGGANAIGLPLGTLLALVIAKTNLPYRGALERLLLAMLFLPLVVQAAAWQAALGYAGWLSWMVRPEWFSGWPAAVWVHGTAAVPWVALAVASALRSVPRELEEDALQNASGGQVLLRVSLRHVLPAMLAASLWVGVLCASEITVTDLFQLRTFAEEVYTQAEVQTESPSLATSDLWLGTATLAALLCAALSAAWSPFHLANLTSNAHRWVWQLGPRRWLAATSVLLLMLLLVGIPLVSLVSKAGAKAQQIDGTYHRHFSPTKAMTLVATSPKLHRREAGCSLTLGCTAALGATALGLILAWALRTKKLPPFPTAALLACGFALPGPVLGLWMIQLFNHPKDSPLFFLTWYYDHTLLVPIMVQTLRALPLTTLLITSQLATIPQEVLDSATSEGAGWWQRLAQVALPMRWPAVLAAGCMALVVAWGDLAATKLVMPPGASTLTIRIFGLLHYGAEDRVAALCLALALAVGVWVTLAVELPRWLGRKNRMIAK